MKLIASLRINRAVYPSADPQDLAHSFGERLSPISSREIRAQQSPPRLPGLDNTLGAQLSGLYQSVN
jgi:hypothetical protein